MKPKTTIIVNIIVAAATIIGCIGEIVLAKDKMNEEGSSESDT